MLWYVDVRDMYERGMNFSMDSYFYFRQNNAIGFAHEKPVKLF